MFTNAQTAQIAFAAASIGGLIGWILRLRAQQKTDDWYIKDAKKRREAFVERSSRSWFHFYHTLSKDDHREDPDILARFLFVQSSEPLITPWEAYLTRNVESLLQAVKRAETHTDKQISDMVQNIMKDRGTSRLARGWDWDEFR